MHGRIINLEAKGSDIIAAVTAVAEVPKVIKFKKGDKSLCFIGQTSLSRVRQFMVLADDSRAIDPDVTYNKLQIVSHVWRGTVTCLDGLIPRPLEDFVSALHEKFLQQNIHISLPD